MSEEPGDEQEGQMQPATGDIVPEAPEPQELHAEAGCSDDITEALQANDKSEDQQHSNAVQVDVDEVQLTGHCSASKVQGRLATDEKGDLVKVARPDGADCDDHPARVARAPREKNNLPEQYPIYKGVFNQDEPEYGSTLFGGQQEFPPPENPRDKHDGTLTVERVDPVTLDGLDAYLDQHADSEAIQDDTSEEEYAEDEPVVLSDLEVEEERMTPLFIDQVTDHMDMAEVLNACDEAAETEGASAADATEEDGPGVPEGALDAGSLLTDEQLQDMLQCVRMRGAEGNPCAPTLAVELHTVGLCDSSPHALRLSLL